MAEETVLAEPPGRVRKVRVEELESVVIRFAGDSGDGMQLTGTQFTTSSFAAGNDLSTLPDYPAEIRAPAGSLGGVSGFQVQFSSQEVYTPGDAPDVLVCMNPAALKVNIPELRKSGIIIANTSEFTKANLDKAEYETNPVEDGSLSGYQVFKVDVTGMTMQALRETSLSNKEKERCKNFYALGLLYWLYHRPMDQTLRWLQEKFGSKPQMADANSLALRAGYHYGETTEAFAVTYHVKPAKIEKGTYRNLTGNDATALGFVAAAQISGLPLFLGSYPITPASEILHELSRYKNYGVITFQAEDEIAGICAAIGAAYGGSLGITTTSGPGLALKTEAMGLAVIVEVPLVIVDVQRGGPSTGLPTKPEQSDLLMAVFGRHGESPLPVLAPGTPADCFDMAIEASRIAVKYMTPVILLTDGFLANSSEPWRVPASGDLPDIAVHFWTNPEGFAPYRRDPETLARLWVKPGTPGLQHRIGGLEKDALTGEVSYDPINHEVMVNTRAAKIAGIAKDLPPIQVEGPPEGDLLILGWGSVAGALTQAVEELREDGYKVSGLTLRYLNPMQSELGSNLKKFKKILIPEMNLGQLQMLVRARYGIDAIGLHKVQGRPIRVDEIINKAQEILGGEGG